ncbi:MAG: alpha/beta fold hydrolase, partial [Paracraurococcus sp.]
MDRIALPRRRLLGTTALGAALARAAQAQPTQAQPVPAPAAAPPGFGPLRQVRAGALEIGYAEAGPPAGPPVLLLHGWPYDIHSYAEVAPLLAAAGYRVIVPYLRGYGTTRFRAADAVRNGQQAALALDALALLDA